MLSRVSCIPLIKSNLGQRPLQAVRLLQKEREERDTDENFTTQKEDIIAKARELDKQRTEYKA